RPDSTDESWAPPGRTAELGEDDSADARDGAGTRVSYSSVAVGPVAPVASMRALAGSDSGAELSLSPSLPDSVAVTGRPDRDLAGIDGWPPTSSGPRPLGSNLPFSTERRTGLTSTPSLSSVASKPLLECSPRDRFERLATSAEPSLLLDFT